MPQELCEIIQDAAAHGVFLKTWVKGTDRQRPLLSARWHRAAVTGYDLSPYQALIQPVWRWCFKGQEWVRQKFLLSLFVVVVRISMSWKSCYTLYTCVSNQETAMWRWFQNAPVLLCTSCVTERRAVWHCQKCRRDIFFSHMYNQMQVEAVLLVTIDRLAQSTGISRFVLALTLLLTWKLKGIRRWLTSVTLRRKGFSIWNITCPLQRSCLVGNAGREMWTLIAISLLGSSQLWKGRLGTAGCNAGVGDPDGHKQPCLLGLGSLLSPLLERFNVWQLAVYIFFFC